SRARRSVSFASERLKRTIVARSSGRASRMRMVSDVSSLMRHASVGSVMRKSLRARSVLELRGDAHENDRKRRRGSRQGGGAKDPRRLAASRPDVLSRSSAWRIDALGKHEASMNPKRRRRKRHGSARRLADEAWEALVRGEIDLAVRIAGRAIARAADSPPAWTDYVRLLTEAGDLAKAERAARNAILIGPSDPEAWV